MDSPCLQCEDKPLQGEAMDAEVRKLVSDGWYNGFSLQVRLAVGRMQNAAFRSGQLRHIRKCCACGLDEGVTLAHLEDYDDWKRYFPMCFACHSTLHGRYKRPQVFHRYLQWLEEGNKPIPFKTHFWKPYQDAYCRNAVWPTSGRGGPPNLTLMRKLRMEFTTSVPSELQTSQGAPLLVGQHDGSVGTTMAQRSLF